MLFPFQAFTGRFEGIFQPFQTGGLHTGFPLGLGLFEGDELGCFVGFLDGNGEG